jgi:Right handed beta helix region
MIRRTLPLLAAGFFLVMPASALATAGTRLYVSGVGDDANPCSRTAPCKTFAGALAKETGPGGEIDALDPGGFGQVTLPESVTLSGAGTDAGILAGSGNGINITAPTGSTVIVNDLNIDGDEGTGATGISITGGGNVVIENSEIWGFADDGISFTPSAGGTLDVVDSTIHGNSGVGLLATSGSVTLDGDTFADNTCGVAVASTGSTNFATNCGTGATAAAAPATVDVSNTTISGNSGFGLLANGSGDSAEIAGSTITANLTGLSAQNGGQIVQFGVENAVFGNGTDGTPTSTEGPQAVQGPAGPAGPAGPSGPAAVGPPSPLVLQGATGPSGQIELVTCTTKTKIKHVGHRTRKVKVQTCKAKLVSGTVTFQTTPKRAAATLSRLEPRLAPGRYVVTVKLSGRVLERKTVTIG